MTTHEFALIVLRVAKMLVILLEKELKVNPKNREVYYPPPK